MKAIKALFAAGALAMGIAMPAYATYSASFQGVTFNINPVDSNTFTFEIVGANAATGDWTGAAYLAAFDFKNLGIDFTQAGVSASAFYQPAGPTTPGVNAQLNANICNTNVGETGTICFDPDPNIAVTADMLFTIDITGATLNIASTGPHLQIMFSTDATRTDCKTTAGVTTCNDSKLGSLYSQDIPLASSSSSSSTSGGGESSSSGIPEPGTSALALLGLGLLAGSFVIRKARQS